MLQTSSNQRDSHRLSRASVTNVVNLSPKTTIFSEKALGLTTFVTTGQKATRKTPWIDDVCNNTQRSAPKSQHDKPDHIGGPENPAAVPMDGGWAWPAFETTRRATRQHTRPHRCGGRRRDRRVRLRHPRAVAGPGRTTHRDPDRLEAAARPAGPGRASRRRAERSSLRGRLAGGPPPTGTPSSPAQKSRRGARNTRGATSNAHKNAHPETGGRI